MSTYQAIEAVSTALQHVISERIDVPEHSHAAHRSDVVVTIGLPPKDEDIASEEVRVNLFLYRVTENPFLANQQILGHGHPNGYGHPPLSLNLHYLLTAYGLTSTAGLEDVQDDRTAQQLLGSAMRILHDAPIITRALADVPALNYEHERAKLTLEPLSIEDVSKVWTALNRPYRLSAAYEASVVQIESGEPDHYPRRVGEPPAGPHSLVIGGVVATIVEVRSAERAGPYAKTNEQVVLTGRNLAIDDVAATVGGIPAVVSSSTETRATIVVPDDPALLAGIVPVRLTARANLGDPPVGHTIMASNVAPLVVLPKVKTVSVAGTTIAIDGKRLFSRAAECLTIVGDVAVPRAEYDETASNAGHIEFDRPAGLPRGTYSVRVRVNGAEDMDGRTVALP